MGDYLLGWATLNSTLYVLLGMYISVIVLQMLVLSYFVYQRKRLPKRFLLFGYPIVLTNTVGFLLVILFLVTINAECDLSRQMAYSFFFSGFILYDYYQLVNIQERLKQRHWILVFLFLCRCASVILSTVDFKGVVALPIASGPMAGYGPCKSKVENWVVYQEHVVVCIYEMAVVYYVFKHAYSFTSDTLKFWDILTTVLDFEALSFVAFMLVEMAYLIIFSTVPTTYISYINTVYLQFPVALFFATSVYLSLNKKKEKMSKLASIQEVRRMQSSGMNSSTGKNSSKGSDNKSMELLTSPKTPTFDKSSHGPKSQDKSHASAILKD
ncbi:hypothetical protein EDD86DRAFT_244058 [Gorgonomyces haynaldii]|nr:hypothetical protein EDD86DRAFT_244058 [Gorgonomyces haynaldii]